MKRYTIIEYPDGDWVEVRDEKGVKIFEGHYLEEAYKKIIAREEIEIIWQEGASR